MPSGQGIFLGMSAYLKFQCNPRCDFLRRPSISKKINKDRRADSCEADEDVDSDSKVLLHLSDASHL